jgi:hypothetical protein
VDTAENVLLAEYNHAVEVANHIDNLRNVLTSFFLTLNGGALIAATLVFRDVGKTTPLGSPETFLAVVVISVFVLGSVFVATIARMRRVQIERYRIQNGILDKLLPGEGRSAIPHTDWRLARDAGGHAMGKRTTGSYLWTLAIMLPTAGLATFAIWLIISPIHHLASTACSWTIAVPGGVAVFILNDLAYFALSKFETRPFTKTVETTDGGSKD